MPADASLIIWSAESVSLRDLFASLLRVGQRRVGILDVLVAQKLIRLIE